MDELRWDGLMCEGCQGCLHDLSIVLDRSTMSRPFSLSSTLSFVNPPISLRVVHINIKVELSAVLADSNTTLRCDAVIEESGGGILSSTGRESDVHPKLFT